MSPESWTNSSMRRTIDPTIRKLSTLILTGTLVFLCGCLQTQTVITVKRDGSGTVRQRLVMKREIAMMMTAFSNQVQAEGGKKSWGIFDERELRNKARSMGQGVRYVSGKKISSAWGEGYEAVYSFKDINTLSVQESPDVQTDMSRRMLADSTKEKKFITFEFTKGSPAALVIHLPSSDKNKQSERDTTKKQNVNDDLMMAKMILKEMRISTVVQVQGSVTESDATFRDGGKITLINVDFDKLLDDETLLRKAMEYHDIPEDEATELMKKHPGLAIEQKKLIAVRFK